MNITIRKGEEANEWGFVETFKVYRYKESGTISALLAVTPEGNIATPYVLRGSKFIPLDEIEREVGVERYLKAKKPFYSMLSDGFIAYVRAGYDFEKEEFLKDKTSYEIYTAGQALNLGTTRGTIKLRRIFETSVDLDKLMIRVAEELAKCGGDRLAYLTNRI